MLKSKTASSLAAAHTWTGLQTFQDHIVVGDGVLLKEVSDHLTVRNTGDSAYANVLGNYLYAYGDVVYLGGTSSYLQSTKLTGAAAFEVQTGAGDLVLDANGGHVKVEGCDMEFSEVARFDAIYDNGDSGAADTIDWGNGNLQKSTLTDDCAFTLTAPDSPARLNLILIQGAAPPHNPSWPASVLWAGGAEPVWSVGLAAVDLVSFLWDGTNYLGAANIGFA